MHGCPDRFFFCLIQRRFPIPHSDWNPGNDRDDDASRALPAVPPLCCLIGVSIRTRDPVLSGSKCKHTDIRQDRRIIFAMTVAVGADILHQ